MVDWPELDVVVTAQEIALQAIEQSAQVNERRAEQLPPRLARDARRLGGIPPLVKAIGDAFAGRYDKRRQDLAAAKKRLKKLNREVFRAAVRLTIVQLLHAAWMLFWWLVSTLRREISPWTWWQRLVRFTFFLAEIGEWLIFTLFLAEIGEWLISMIPWPRKREDEFHPQGPDAPADGGPQHNPSQDGSGPRTGGAAEQRKRTRRRGRSRPDESQFE